MATILKSLNGYGFDAVRLGGKAPAYYIHPHNLLDNSDFTNPVNQRGRTGYFGNIYTIDRWFLWTSDATGSVSVEENGVALNPQTAERIALAQRFPKGYLSGVAYTFAYCDNSGTITINNNPVITSDEGFDYVEIVCNAWKKIAWAVLYEGTYTADTLPPYVPKGYAAELTECLRYYQAVSSASWTTCARPLGSAEFLVNLSATSPMRTVPQIAGKFKLFLTGGWTEELAPVSIDLTVCGYAAKIATQADAEIGKAYIVMGTYELIADL